MDPIVIIALTCLGLPITCAIGYAIVARVNVWMDKR